MKLGQFPEIIMCKEENELHQSLLLNVAFIATQHFLTLAPTLH